MLLYLVRHAAVAVRPERPAPEWHLSREGREAAEALASEEHWNDLPGLHTSPEPKALATAQRIAAPGGLPVWIDSGLREVEGREWVAEGYPDLVRRYIDGTGPTAWEPRDEALERIRRCIDGVAARHAGGDVAIVSHGLVLTLYLAELLGLDVDAAFDLWSRMQFPDVAAADVKAKRLSRAFGEGAGRNERYQR